MLIPTVSWCSEVSRGVLVHALDDDDSRVNFTGEVIGKPVEGR